MALVAGIAATFMGATVIGLVGIATGADVGDPPPAVAIGGTAFQDLALIASALLFAAMAARPRPWHFGLRPTRLGAATGWLLAVWAAFFAFSAVWVSALGIHERDQLPEELGADRSTVALVAVMVLVTVLAPVAEEFFFRGYFFTALRSWRGPWLAAIITGLVFGAIHAGSAPLGFLVPLAAFGFGLCLLYWRTGSLYPCISLHAFNNSLALGVTQHWRVWQVIALMIGANLVIGVILLGLGRRAPTAGSPAAALS